MNKNYCGQYGIMCENANEFYKCKSTCCSRQWSNTSQYVDLLNQESSDLLVNLLAQKDHEVFVIKRAFEDVYETMSELALKLGLDAIPSKEHYLRAYDRDNNM